MTDETLAHIAEVLSVFHDGVIARVARIGSNVRLRIEIDYLAEQAGNPDKIFEVVLVDCEVFRFLPWDESDAITDLAEIQALQLGVLSPSLDGDLIDLLCEVPGFSGSSLKGGELFIRAARVDVAFGDEELTHASLFEIASSYWSRSR